MGSFGREIHPQLVQSNVLASMKSLLLISFFLTVVGSGTLAQQKSTVPTTRSDLVYGRPFRVPQVRVYLTDEETGGPFAEKDVKAKYCWV